MNPSRSMIRFGISCLAAICGLASATVLADTAPTLRFDPFRAPPPEGQDAAAAGDRGEPRSAFTPVLRSTIVGDSRALVNLGGEVLAIGEEAHGYRLIAVGLYDAVFEKDGRRVRLEVTGDEGGRS